MLKIINTVLALVLGIWVLLSYRDRASVALKGICTLLPVFVYLAHDRKQCFVLAVIVFLYVFIFSIGGMS